VELIFLGTGAGMPSSRRNVSSAALRFNEHGNSFWLFDCGEATQHQIMGTSLKLSKLDKVFITHLHGDHLFGLPGLLTSRAHQGANTPLQVFGPRGLASFIESALHISGSHLGYDLQIRELEGEYLPDAGIPLYEDDRFRVYCGKLDHRIECFGYRIEEKEKAGKLDDQKLAEVGVPSGPLYGKLKKGETVKLADGTVLDGKMFIGRQTPGRIVAIMGDTRANNCTVKLAKDADVLVHEATFSAELQRLAFEYHHATTRDAAEAAIQANAQVLIITHLSARYQDETVEKLLSETQNLFPSTYLAEDRWAYLIAPRKIEGL